MMDTSKPDSNRVQSSVIAEARRHTDRVVSQELEEYLLYLQSPLRMVWINLLAGIFRGLGAVLGASVVVALLVWLLSQTLSLPLVGQHMRGLHDQFTDFIEEARYQDDFERIEGLLRDIADNMEPPQ